MTLVTMEWESRLGRRLRVRDLHILSSVVKCGGMAKAARQLAMSQPAVSQAISNLEHLLRVRLLDRNTHGVEPTIYADALLKRSATVFDELKQGVRDIEFLADPTVGVLTIGYSESVAGTGLLPQMFQRFSEKFPRVAVRADIVPSPAFQFRGLRDRTHDLVLARMWLPSPGRPEDDLNVEEILDDPLVVVVGAHNRWSRRRKVDLAELVNEPWILPPANTWSYEQMAQAFRARGLRVPTASLTTYSLDLRTKLPTTGPFIAAVPKSVLHDGGEEHRLKMLPVDMPMRPWPITILTLKNRTVSPVVDRFIICAREIAKSLATNDGRRKR